MLEMPEKKSKQLFAHLMLAAMRKNQGDSHTGYFQSLGGK